MKVAFLWHMHQPYYRNPYTCKLELPWVRLHGLKDYYGMVRILKDFPGFRATYNLVPSLLAQLEGYLAGQRDVFQDIFKKRADALTPGELRFLVRHFFSANYDHLIAPYPRYLSLFRKREAHKGRGSGINWREVFSLDEIRDIQVWFPLCYFDEEYKETDERVRGLIAKGSRFTEEDKSVVEAAELELLGKIIPEYKAFAETGQIEIATTPFYHPILPLLCDPQLGRTSNPHLPQYPLHFNWREDAVSQVIAALDYMEKTFDRRPVGIWPSEGSLSEEVLGILETAGVAWTATDELNLSQSLGIPFERDHHFVVQKPDVLYKPYRMENGNTRIFFRDHHLSDLIGFHYQKMSYREAAEDLVERIKAVGRSAGGRDLVLPIILDGENAWEYYPGSGREFLREFFRLMEADDTVETVTFSQCLDMETGVIKEFSAGSWINGNFDIWIGDEEDRRGWRLIEAARGAFERKRAELPGDTVREILEYIHIAEGSDWFWWFGKENFTPDLHIFDHLLRKNLQKVYDLLGMPPPPQLFTPVAGALKKAETEVTAPTSFISPRIDGCDGYYFEWLNAGRVDVTAVGGAMTISNALVSALYYGFDQRYLYLRVDTPKRARYYFDEGYSLHISIVKDGETRVLDLEGIGDGETIAVDRVIECRVLMETISLAPGDVFSLSLEWKAHGEFFQTIPTHGRFTLPVPTPRDYADFWLV